jgi:hypothetical protein
MQLESVRLSHAKFTTKPGVEFLHNCAYNRCEQQCTNAA